MAAIEGGFLHTAVLFLGAAVIAVPVFKKLRLGSVLGYLCAGALIGPFGLALIAEPEEVLHFAEFGVVLLLFIIGLELRPQRLWAMKGEIFGLGLMQVAVTAALLYAVLTAFDWPWQQAVIAALALSLSSTAFALQILEEKGTLNSDHGNTAFSILLFQDLAIVPLIALVAWLSPISDGGEAGTDWIYIAKTIGAIALVIGAGKYLLNPFFRIIALTRAQEIFTSAALLLVIGAALLMQAVGLSMALGAFLVGVMLADSEYRHQLETDIEPFRGILLGLFFIAVGMSVNWPLVADNIGIVLASVAGLMAIKGIVVYGLCRVFRKCHATAWRAAITIPQGGEFAFVLFSMAASLAVISATRANLLTAIVTLSMAATPLVGAIAEKLSAKLRKDDQPDVDGIEMAELQSVIIVGFGRFGQIISRVMAARGINATAIDNDPKRIQLASLYGNKVYFGDVRRSDVLATAGAANADLICLCINDREATRHAAKYISELFPKPKLLVRVYDRNHALDLMEIGLGVEQLYRETFDAGVSMARHGLSMLETEHDVIDQIADEFRRRDIDMLHAQVAEGRIAGMAKVHESYQLDRNDARTNKDDPAMSRL
ncbi:monovalent cation:proton antiporter-2 (CPA2) family protein [Thalassospira xianhensis]|uniref:RCK N-terminal domain-containing protein n=1 Tax=Thalassospira xianhensis MCCC 1A02616 TaxID=1177929 RepID=A0A367U7J0_9PROT|nr:monovalent cation:proton antiporter-2 (CPA2) family protein [Thalassospira xianhensis]RCK04267.1 hypothetical protein TH5_20565 [Thalassospira xianhensis MCCC 1A02616]